jgi:hypothetical protein
MKKTTELDRKSLIIGEHIEEYTRAIKTAFEYARELKKLGIGQPWIDVEYESTQPDFSFNGILDVIRGEADKPRTFHNRIRLEVR